MERIVDNKDTARLEALRSTVLQAPESAEAHLRLGSALLKRGAMKDAEEALRRAVELDPSLSKAWVNLGGLLMARWDFAGSIEANSKALEVAPDLVEAYYNKGLGHLYLGEAQAMVDCFRRVLGQQPGNPGAHYHLAVGLYALGHMDECRKELAVALELGYSPQPEFMKAMERMSGGQVPTMEVGSHSTNKPHSR